MTDLLTPMQVNRDRARAHRAKADAADKRVSESIERSDTDGFLSQWAGGLTAQLERARADIAEAGDVAEFTGLYFGDERVVAKLVHYRCKFSHTDKSNWFLDKAESKRFGRRFIPSGPRSRIQKQLGLSERKELAPAYAFMNGRGTGLSGSAWVQVARKDPDAYGTDATLIEEETA